MALLQNLNSPVLDLASTLSIQAENEIEEENLAFLRTPYTASAETHAEILNRELRFERRRLHQLARERSEAETTRTPTASSDLPTMPPSPVESSTTWSERIRSRLTAPYGERIPSQQSLYDWAPGAEEGDNARVTEIFNELRTSQPNTHPEILRVLARARLDSERIITLDRLSREQTSAARQNAATSNSETSLRSAAILQNVRRNQRFTERSRNLMQRYVTDMARASNDGNYDSSSLRWFRENAAAVEVDRRERQAEFIAMEEENRHEQARLAWHGTQRASESVPAAAVPMDNIRRRYLEDPSGKTTEFEKVIKYLHFLRSADRELGKVSNDFTMQTPPLDRPWFDRAAMLSMRHSSHPRPTSWLTPGTTFTGFQQSSPVPSSSITYHRLANNQILATTNPPSPETRSTFDPSRPWLTHPAPPNPNTQPLSMMLPVHDKWTVNVAIHDVDFTAMTLQGTMEAFNVPSAATNPLHPTSVSAKATFSTYLEGELIDFTTNTLLTESFRATSDIDATYWRKLEPFRDMTDEDIARALLDPRWIEEQLMDNYVLMRWKEKCFVQPLHSLQNNSTTKSSHPSQDREQYPPAAIPPPLRSQTTFLSATAAGAGPTSSGDGNATNAGYGLSISGFYYVSLRRTDGRCEGLYFDPQSTPYQHLELRPTERLWSRGVFEFR